MLRFDHPTSDGSYDCLVWWNGGQGSVVNTDGTRITVGRGLLRGAAAGAAGTTFLNVVAYMDMVVRARPASSAPEEAAERLAAALNITIPGDEAQRKNRVAGLGPLTGLAAGIGVGMIAGIARAAGWRSGLVATGLATAVGAMIAGDAPIAMLGVSDPRTWTIADWASDVVPHLAYGMVTAAIVS